ncbi:beta strand repeat-containing protein, partial [Methylobacter psychrophilus]|uniref:beta strand repeat-containing protein n=1 Tax=Methylobacter psychrophilus TaxID=96941 RepID=UPI0021D4AD4A
AVTKTYDGSLAAAGTAVVTLGTLYNNASNGGTLDSLSGGTFAYTDANAGTGKTVTTDAVTVNDGNLGGNYTVSYANNAASIIDKAALSLIAVANNRVYDRTSTATLSSLSLSGLVTGETLTPVVAGDVTFADKYAADGKTVTITNIGIIAGIGDTGLVSNYSISSTATTTANITKADIHVAGVVGIDKVYDGTLTAGINANAASLVGVISGDVTSVGSITGTFVDKNVGVGKSIVGSAFVLTGADGVNYNLIQPTGLTASITPRSLAVSATGVNKDYDGLLGATVTLADNRISNDNLTFTYNAAFLDKNVGKSKYIGVSGIALGGTDAGNYTFNLTAAAFANISKATLTVSATGVNKIYDGNSTASLTLSDNRMSNDQLSISFGSASFQSPAAGHNKLINVSGINVTGDDVGNYTFNVTAQASADITGKLIYITSGVLANSKIYDGNINTTLNTGNVLYTGAINDDVLSFSAGAGTFADKNVGNAKAVTVTSMVLSGTNSDSYELVLPTNLMANITPAMLTITAVSDSKVYDGTATSMATPTVTFGSVFTGDSLTGLSESFASKNVLGTNASTLNVGNGYTLDDGNNGANYTVTLASGTGTITPAALTITAVSDSKVYDGTTTSLMTPTVTSGTVFTGDSLTGLSESFANKNVMGMNGSTLNVGTGYTLIDNNNGANYAVTLVSSTGSITPAALTLTPISSIKTYDGTITSTGTVTVAGNVSGDIVNVSEEFSSKNALGNNASTLGIKAGYTVVDSSAADMIGNYTITNTATATGTINQLALAGSILTGTSVYGAAMSPGLASFINAVSGDDLGNARVEVNTNGNTSSSGYLKAGNYTGIEFVTALSGADAGNYSYANIVGNYTINKLALSGSVASGSSIYGSSLNQGAASFSNAISNDDLGIATVAVDSAGLTSSSGNFIAGFHIGKQYVSGLSGVDADNYTFTEITGDYNVNKKNIVVAGIISTANKVYDGNRDAIINSNAAGFNGMVAGDVLSVTATGLFDTKNVGSNKTVTLTSNYSGADAGNYNITDQASSTAGVSAKALTVSGISAANKVYDGNRDAIINSNAAGFNGMVAGDVLSVTATGLFDTKNVGSNKTVTLTSNYSGADAGNYNITDQANSTAGVSAKALTVSGISAANKVYDGNLDATINSSAAGFDGMVADDVLSVTATGLFDTKNVGSNKTVTLTSNYSGADAGNYNITDQANSTAGVSAKALTVSGISAANKVYDGNRDATINGSAAGFNGMVAGDVLSVTATGLFDTKNVGSNKTVTLTSNYSGADAGNYNITDQANSTAGVSAKALTV